MPGPLHRSVSADNTYTKRSRPILGRHSSYLNRPSSRLSKKSPTRTDVSQEDAQWFLRLPDKVRRKHFTKEEQALLAGRCESVILDAADEALYKLGGQNANRSIPSLPSFSSSQSSSESIQVEELVDSAVDMDDSVLESFRWMDEDEDLDLTLDDYHNHMIETAASPRKSSSSIRPSFRRTLSLTNLPSGAPRLSLANRPSYLPATASLPSPERDVSSLENASQAIISNPAPWHSAKRSVSAVDSTAKHYQDPEARLKLRVYLASPQKFEEALEFGFPAMHDDKRVHPRRQSFSKYQSMKSEVRTFFDDDEASLFEDGDLSDDKTLPDARQPTFSTNSLAYNEKCAATSNVTFADLEPPSFRPHMLHTLSEPYAHTSAGNREMTLRMTLTRPDLRVEKGESFARTTDPLALDQLPPVVDGNDVWVKVPKDVNVVKRLWRTVTGR